MFKDIIKRPCPGRLRLPAIPICCFSLKRARSFGRGVCRGVGVFSGPPRHPPGRRGADGAGSHPRHTGTGTREVPEGGREEVAVLLGSHLPGLGERRLDTEAGWQQALCAPRAGGEDTGTKPPHTLGTAMAQQGTARHRQSGFLVSGPFLGCSTLTAHREQLLGWAHHPPAEQRHQHPAECLDCPWKVLGQGPPP